MVTACPSSVQVERRLEHLGECALIRDNSIALVELLLMVMITYWLQMEITNAFRSSGVLAISGFVLPALPGRHSMMIQFCDAKKYQSVMCDAKKYQCVMCDAKKYRCVMCDAKIDS